MSKQMIPMIANNIKVILWNQNWTNDFISYETVEILAMAPFRNFGSLAMTIAIKSMNN